MTGTIQEKKADTDPSQLSARGRFCELSCKGSCKKYAMSLLHVHDEGRLYST